jgi:hypothetical protein
MHLGQDVSIHSLSAHGEKVIFCEKHNLKIVQTNICTSSTLLTNHNVIMVLTPCTYFSPCFRAKPTSRILLKKLRQSSRSPPFHADGSRRYHEPEGNMVGG